MNIYSAAIVGVTGYSGREADRILKHHPSVKVTGRFASKSDGSGIEAYSLDAVKRAAPDVVITATEHDVSLRIVPELLTAGIPRDRYERRISHEGCGALSEVVWIRAHVAGIAAGSRLWTDRDVSRTKFANARLVANPGCYATSVIVPLAPLYAAGVIGKNALVVADGKSGVSGAGRHPKQETHFCEVNENLRAYGVLKHRHTPEMLACLPGASADNFVFTPHLIPITRGILTRLCSSTTAWLLRARRAGGQVYGFEIREALAGRKSSRPSRCRRTRMAAISALRHPETTR